MLVILFAVTSMNLGPWLGVPLGAALWTSGCGTETPAPDQARLCDVAPPACGGDVNGAWKVRACPLELTGEVNVAPLGLGCVSGKITSGSLQVSGRWIADANTNVFDLTTTEGVYEFELTAACLSVSATPVTCERIGVAVGNSLGVGTSQCADNAETGGCTCSGAFRQEGGMATVSPAPLQMGSYSLAANELTTSGAGRAATYAYCVEDDTLHLSLPATTEVGLVRGAITLDKE